MASGCSHVISSTRFSDGQPRMRGLVRFLKTLTGATCVTCTQMGVTVNQHKQGAQALKSPWGGLGGTGGTTACASLGSRPQTMGQPDQRGVCA